VRARYYQAIFYSKGLSNLAIFIPSHCAGITCSLPTTRLEGRGSAPGLDYDNSSPVRRSVGCPSSTDASYASRISSSQKNSFGMFSTKSQMFSGHRRETGLHVAT
jgi:hypothetical protein